MSRIIGIDLGTTNSCVAVLDGGRPIVIPGSEGSRTTPSVVGFGESGERLVGHAARRALATHPASTVFSAKRLIGRRFASPEVERARATLGYAVVPAPNGDAWIQVRGRAYSPAQIQAVVLRELRRAAEEFLGEPATQAVVTVPAYFDDSQRQATKDAGAIAGLSVLRIVNEPTAAALGYGLGGGPRRTVAVYDLGGGTFDISILEIGEGVFEVRATSGDTFLGGDDFDQRLVEHLAERFRQEQGADLRPDPVALQRLREACSRAKHELSAREQARIALPFAAVGPDGPRHLDQVLTREALEDLVRDLVERTLAPCRSALEKAGVTPAEISEVILVGGQTRMPLVQRAVRELFGREPYRGVNPDEVVAAGAAIQAGILAGQIEDVLLLDVTPLSLGIETRGGIFTRLIEANTTIPVRRTRTFTTVEDHQASVTVHVLQGEREMAADNRSLGNFELIGIPPAPRGVPRVDVSFDIDANGIVKVAARDLGSGRSQEIRITASGGLSPEEVAAMRRDAELHGEEDGRRRAQVQLRNEAETLLYSAERALEESRAALGAEESARIRSAAEQVRSLLAEGPAERLRAAVSALGAESRALARLTLRADDAAAAGEGAGRAGRSADGGRVG